MAKHQNELLSNVHLTLDKPSTDGISHLAAGSYQYFHYKCDSFNDVVRIHKFNEILFF